MPTPRVMPDRMRETVIAVEHIVVIDTVDPTGNPDVGFPIHLIKMAVIDSRRSIRSGASGQVDGAIVPDSAALHAAERYSCKSKRLRLIKRDY